MIKGSQDKPDERSSGRESALESSETVQMPLDPRITVRQNGRSRGCSAGIDLFRADQRMTAYSASRYTAGIIKTAAANRTVVMTA